MYAEQTAKRIAGVIPVETRHGSCQPGRGRGAGVLYQFRVRRMLKRLLTLAIVIESEFIHGAGADRPSMGNVPLLEALFHSGSEAWQIGTSEFEASKWVLCGVVVEIVIDAQVLLLIQPVVKPGCQLVATNGPDRHGADQRTAVWRCRNKLQKVNRGWIHASERDLIILKDACVKRTSRNASRKTDSSVAPRAVIQKLRIV